MNKKKSQFHFPPLIPIIYNQRSECHVTLGSREITIGVEGKAKDFSFESCLFF